MDSQQKTPVPREGERNGGATVLYDEAGDGLSWRTAPVGRTADGPAA
ncbi:hypothetical protein AB0L42_16000 [Streptomyces sp. NPDC052287]